MQQDMEMATPAHLNVNHYMAEKKDIRLCVPDHSNIYDGNGFSITSTAGEESQLATVTAYNCIGAQGMQGTPHLLLRAGTPNIDPIMAGHRLLEDCDENETRPLPVFLEGRQVDLLQLWMEVLDHGGYEKVTGTSMWASISENLGFGQGSGAALKLVYAKNLNRYESRVIHKNGLYPTGESSTSVIGSGSSTSPESSDCHKESNGETPSKRRRLSYLKEQHAIHSSQPEYNLPPVSTVGIEALVGMMEWIRRLALNPGDPKKGQGPRGSKQNEPWVENCSNMVIKVRSILWGRKELKYYGGLSGNMKIPPALYYKDLPKPNARTLEKLRANQSRAIKCGLHLSGDALDVRTVRSPWLYQTPNGMLTGGSGEQGLDLSNAYVRSMSEALSIGYLLNNKATRKRIPIGVHFQAQIPPWTGKGEQAVKEMEGFSGIDEGLSSTGFDGSLVWPLPGRKIITRNNMRVGTGRPLTCACTYPMSIECVRMHVLAEHEKLKQELGDACNSLGFDDMGEIACKHWTKKEELAFDLTVKLNPSSLGKNFWDELPIALPGKSVKELVSFYFNVFVARRRAIENRTMHDAIDSDDDEKDLSSNESAGKNANVQFGLMMPNYFTSPLYSNSNLSNLVTRWAHEKAEGLSKD